MTIRKAKVVMIWPNSPRSPNGKGVLGRPLRPTQRGGRCPQQRTAITVAGPGPDRGCVRAPPRPLGRGLSPYAGEMGHGGRQRELDFGPGTPPIARLAQAQLHQTGQAMLGYLAPSGQNQVSPDLQPSGASDASQPSFRLTDVRYSARVTSRQGPETAGLPSPQRSIVLTGSFV